MWGRALLIAVGALLGGAALGRRGLDRAVERRLAVEIERAKAVAMAELDKTVSAMLAERLRAFVITTAIKAAVIAAAYALYQFDVISGAAMHWTALAIIALFLIRDSLATLPFVAPAVRLARRHNWRPRRMLSELVAGHVFERAYAEALLEIQSGPNRFWIALSKYSAENLSRDVAVAVSDVARHTAFDRIWPRAALALGKAALLAALYVTFLVFTVELS